MSIGVVVTAAGMGTRLGFDMPKALVALNGQTLVEHALAGVRASGIADQIVVTIPAGCEDGFAPLVGDALVVVGGSTRQESVSKGVSALETDHVLVHDAARCLTPPDVFRRVAQTLRAGHDAVIPVLPVTDTIKVLDRRTEPAAVRETLDRSSLGAVQTPQGFSRDLLLAAHTHVWDGADGAPDDAALVEAMGEQVVTVVGDAKAMKVTTAFDLKLAELLGEPC